MRSAPPRGQFGMRTVAHITDRPDALRQLERVLPDAPLRRVTLQQAEDLVPRHELHALVVDAATLSAESVARLAVLKARYPALLLVAQVPLVPALAQHALVLGQAGVDELLIAGIEEHPDRVRETLARAALRTVVRVIERGAAPLPPILAAANLERGVQSIEALKSARALAAALGYPLAQLRSQLRDAEVFPPKTLAGWCRLLRAARVLGDGDETIERIAHNLQYASVAGLRNTCHELMGVSPGEVRAQGGLWFAGERFREAVREWRRHASLATGATAATGPWATRRRKQRVGPA